MRHQEMGNFRRNIEPIKAGDTQDTIDLRYKKDIELDLERKARRYEIQNPEVVEWVRDSLSCIDHEQLNSVYQRIASRGGELNRTVEAVSPERTFVVSRQGEIGAHSYIARTNSINGDYFKKLLQTHTSREAFVVLFDAICHENAHATGFVNIRKATRGDVSLSAGYEDVFVTGGEVHAQRHLINEGIMELIGELATRMYLAEKPITLPDGSLLTLEAYDRYVREELMKGTDSSTSDHSLGAREFVYRLAEHVAKASGTSPEDVVGRLIAGFFRGGGLSAQQGLSLAETVGPDFVAELAGAETHQDLERLATKYNFPELTPGIHQRTMDYLRSDSLVHAA